MPFADHLYSGTRHVFRCIPRGIRSSKWVATVAGTVAQRFSCHNQNIYTEEYYNKDVESAAARSADVMASSIVKEFAPKNVVDLGCGTGALLQAIQHMEVDVSGLEYSEAGCDLCRRRGLSVRQFDVREDPVPPDMAADVAISCEVAEHLPERYADRLVDALITLAPNVVFTAAQPGQGGTDHHNEQPHDYWIQKFEDKSFRFDEGMSNQWRTNWATMGVQHWYYSNVMVFRKL